MYFFTITWSLTQPFQGKISMEVSPSQVKNNIACVSLAQGQVVLIFPLGALSFVSVRPVVMYL